MVKVNGPLYVHMMEGHEKYDLRKTYKTHLNVVECCKMSELHEHVMLK